jgi:hypothetical protein
MAIVLNVKAYRPMAQTLCQGVLSELVRGRHSVPGVSSECVRNEANARPPSQNQKDPISLELDDENEGCGHPQDEPGESKNELRETIAELESRIFELEMAGSTEWPRVHKVETALAGLSRPAAASGSKKCSSTLRVLDS